MMRRCLLLFACLCVAVLAVAGTVHASKIAPVSEVARMKRQLANALRDLAEQRAAARREGIPLVAADLNRPMPPPGGNAADCYNTIERMLKADPLDIPKTNRSPATPFGYTPEQTTELRKILADRKDVLALIHKAADTRLCVFPRDWALGTNLMFPELRQIRDDAYLISAESYLLAVDGRYEEAVAIQSRGLRIARHSASDPTLLGYLVAMSCEAIALRGMDDILWMAGPNPKVNAQVARAISALPVPLSMHDALRGEFLTAEYTLKQLRKDGPDALGPWLGAPPDPTRSAAKPWSDREREVFSLEIDFADAEYLRRMRIIYPIADEHTQRSRAIIAKALKIPHDRNETAVQSTSEIILTVLLPMYENVERKELGIRSEAIITQASAAVLEAKGRTGAFPEHLPAQFIDPFSGKPIGYRREGADGFVVYSVGAQGTFDGKAGAKHGVEYYQRFPNNW